MPTLEETSMPAEIAAKFVNYTSKHVFLTGKAGTGKTTFLRKLIQLTHKKALIVAPTGIAAINAAGVTIHSLFQMPFGAFFLMLQERWSTKILISTLIHPKL
ncbi:AAA family ATPase [Pedobacter sp. P26]|uniref:AAA family ATPase n=1 Tax=Pedobacter sp. P26 TaxID=3423956 RepID=UPI003D6748B4